MVRGRGDLYKNSFCGLTRGFLAEAEISVQEISYEEEPKDQGTVGRPRTRRGTYRGSDAGNAK